MPVTGYRYQRVSVGHRVATTALKRFTSPGPRSISAPLPASLPSEAARYIMGEFVNIYYELLLICCHVPFIELQCILILYLRLSVNQQLMRLHYKIDKCVVLINIGRLFLPSICKARFTWNILDKGNPFSSQTQNKEFLVFKPLFKKVENKNKCRIQHFHYFMISLSSVP